MICQKSFDELDVDEVLKHYGYKPGEVHRNGVGCGVWRREEAFQKLGSIKEFMLAVDEKKKSGSSSTTTRTSRRHCLSPTLH